MTDPFNPLPLPKDARSPAEMRIVDLSAEPYSDGRRVRVLVNITPFIERPNLTASLTSSDGEEVSSASIVETMNMRMAFTMHIRAPQPDGHYTLAVRLFYADQPDVDQRSIDFEAVEPPPDE
jgi:hypothetical protein